MKRSTVIIGLVLLAGVLVSVRQSQASVAVYLRSTVGKPWGVSTNETAMDRVFGAGNWIDARYETIADPVLQSADFIFMEGGDSNANELETFLAAKRSAIDSWVGSGGSLFLNAAPNEGNGMDFGFGVTLVYPDFSGANIATAANPGHPVFSGPFTPVALSYGGNWFSHATVQDGVVFSSILINGAGKTVLGELDFGSGHVLFGGMTTDNFHSPQPQAANLTANIIEYGFSESNRGVIPEPSTLIVWSTLGFVGIGVGWWRRRRALAA